MERYNLNIDQVHQLLSEAIDIIDIVAEEIDAKYYLHAGTALGAVRHKGFIPWDDDADVMIPISDYARLVEELQKRDLGKFRIIYKEKYATRMQAKLILKGQDEDLLCVDLFPLIAAGTTEREQKLLDRKSNVIRKLYRYKRLRYSDSESIIKKIIKEVISAILIIVPDKLLYQMFEEKILHRYDFATTKYVTNPCGKYGTKNVIRKEWYGEPVKTEFMGKAYPIPAEIDSYLKHYYGNYNEVPSTNAQHKALSKKRWFIGTKEEYEKCIQQ